MISSVDGMYMYTWNDDDDGGDDDAYNIVIE